MPTPQTGTTSWLYFSLLAKEDIYIFLSEGKNTRTSRLYWIILDGWASSKHSALSKCPNGAIFYEKECKILKAQHRV
jgi:hypothetical protein